MPHFMDVHTNMHDVTLQDIEQAHLRDVEAQDRHAVRYLQFFHNATTGQVFCLAEGPSAAACEAVHVEANGLHPETIIEVQPAMFDGFMGGGNVTPLGVTLAPSGEPDTGARAIVFTDIVGSTRLTQDLGDRAGLTLVEAHDRLAGDALSRHGGRKVKHTGDGLMASFVEPSAAVSWAVEVQRALVSYRSTLDALPLHVRIGIHVGQPVVARGDLFGLAVNIASRVCDAAEADEVLVTDAVLACPHSHDLRAHARGEHTFKGLTTPLSVHAVMWGA